MDLVIVTLGAVKTGKECCVTSSIWRAPRSSVSEKLPAVQEARVRSLGQEDPLEEEMAT